MFKFRTVLRHSKSLYNLMSGFHQTKVYYYFMQIQMYLCYQVHFKNKATSISRQYLFLKTHVIMPKLYIYFRKTFTLFVILKQ